MKIYIYARVSTHDDQDPENQLLKMREWADRSGHEIVGEYVDRASGADQNRPGLDEMMSRARKRHIDAIIVVRLDRICRSLINLLNLVEIMEKYGVSLVCLDQDIDMTTASGRLLVHVLGAIAEFERELIRDRVKIDASFRMGPKTDFVFDVMTVSKGRYVGDGTDIPTLSLWEAFTLGGGYYLWQFDFIVRAPDGTTYSHNVTQAHDLPSGGGSLQDTMGVLYVAQTGEYTVTMRLRAIDYQVDATGEVLATGTGTFTIPAGWLT